MPGRSFWAQTGHSIHEHMKSKYGPFVSILTCLHGAWCITLQLSKPTLFDILHRKCENKNCSGWFWGSNLSQHFGACYGKVGELHFYLRLFAWCVFLPLYRFAPFGLQHGGFGMSNDSKAGNGEKMFLENLFLSVSYLQDSWDVWCGKYFLRYLI